MDVDHPSTHPIDDGVSSDPPPSTTPHQPPSSFTDFNADVALNIIQYLNVVDSNRLAVTSKRFFYLVYQYRIVRGPELVTAASWNGGMMNNNKSRSSTNTKGTTRRVAGSSNNNNNNGQQQQQEQYSQKELIQQTIDGLQSNPNLVLSFYKSSRMRGTADYGRTPRNLRDGFHDSTVLLGATSPFIQVNHPAPSSSSSTTAAAAGGGGGASSQFIEHNSVESIMACNFPGAVIVPFRTDSANPTELDSLRWRMDRAERRHLDENGWPGSSSSDSERVGPSSNSSFWKAIILYACGQNGTYAECFLAGMRDMVHIVVGGVCSHGYVSRPKYTVDDLNAMSIKQLRRVATEYNKGQHLVARGFVEKSEIVRYVADMVKEGSPDGGVWSVTDGLFGVVLGGDAPVRSIVSRGYTSLFQPNGKPQNRSNFVVHRSVTLRPSDDGYMFSSNRESDLRPVHMIYELLDTTTGKVLSMESFIRKEHAYGQETGFIGLKRRDGRDGHNQDHNSSNDGFELFMFHRFGSPLEAFVIMTDGSPHETKELGVDETQVDFFSIDGEACRQDMDLTVAKLQAQAQGEDVMGAIMFSCGARGPVSGGLMPESMADATRFHRGFPTVPCLGFYAFQEIGPVALAGNDNVFRSGRSAVQGGTAVFALFIVPKVDKRNYHLDDSSTNVENFIATHVLVSK